MKLVSTIIVHSILQGGPGLLVFSPSVYHYLATGILDDSVQRISVDDCSIPTKHFIDKVGTLFTLKLAVVMRISGAYSLGFSRKGGLTLSRLLIRFSFGYPHCLSLKVLFFLMNVVYCLGLHVFTISIIRFLKEFVGIPDPPLLVQLHPWIGTPCSLFSLMTSVT